MKTIYKEINNDYYAQKSNTVCTLYNPFGEFVGFITRNTAERVEEMRRRTGNYNYKISVKVKK